MAYEALVTINPHAGGDHVMTWLSGCRVAYTCDTISTIHQLRIFWREPLDASVGDMALLASTSLQFQIA